MMDAVREAAAAQNSRRKGGPYFDCRTEATYL